MRLARVIVGCGYAAMMAVSAVAAQEDHEQRVSVAVGGIVGTEAAMAAAQLGAQVPLANPKIQLRFGVQYARSGATMWPGPTGAGACAHGGSCGSFSATDDIMAMTAGVRFDLPDMLYAIATTGVYQWRVSSGEAFGLHRAATGVAIGGGLGTSFSMGRAQLFLEGQVLLGNVARGAYQTTVLAPITLGVRF